VQKIKVTRKNPRYAFWPLIGLMSLTSIFGSFFGSFAEAAGSQGEAMLKDPRFYKRTPAASVPENEHYLLMGSFCRTTSGGVVYASEGDRYYECLDKTSDVSRASADKAADTRGAFLFMPMKIR